MTISPATAMASHSDGGQVAEEDLAAAVLDDLLAEGAGEGEVVVTEGGVSRHRGGTGDRLVGEGDVEVADAVLLADGKAAAAVV